MGEYTAENWIFRKTALPKDGLGMPSDQEKSEIGASRNTARSASRRPKDAPCTDGGKKKKIHASSGHNNGSTSARKAELRTRRTPAAMGHTK